MGTSKSIENSRECASFATEAHDFGYSRHQTWRPAMTDPSRRSFLKHTAAASAGAAAWAWTGGINAAGANERLTVGVIGCGGRGAGWPRPSPAIADVAYVCDPDESRRGRAQEKVRAKHAVTDLRRVLDDQVGRRRGHRHARPLARPGGHSGLRGGQARVRREAAEPQLPRKPTAARRRPAQQRRRATRHAEPLQSASSPAPSRCCARA